MTNSMNKILSSINIIFKKINLLTNIDNYIITKELKGGMNTEIDTYDTEIDTYDTKIDTYDNDIDTYNTEIESVTNIDNEIELNQNALYESIDLNTQLINNLYDLIISLNIDNKKYIDGLNRHHQYEITKLLQDYYYIIKKLEHDRDYYANLAVHSEEENYNNNKINIQKIKLLIDDSISDKSLTEESKQLLQLTNRDHNKNTIHKKPWVHPAPLHDDPLSHGPSYKSSSTRVPTIKY